MTGIQMLFPITTNRTASCLAKYRDHFEWLKDAKFLQDLERDSIDIDTIEEELHALKQEEVLSVRRKITTFLQRNPVQIFLCVLVIFDVCIGISQLLIDIHAVRERLTNREDEIESILQLVRGIHIPDISSPPTSRESELQLVISLLRSHPLLRHNVVNSSFSSTATNISGATISAADSVTSSLAKMRNDEKFLSKTDRQKVIKSNNNATKSRSTHRQQLQQQLLLQSSTMSTRWITERSQRVTVLPHHDHNVMDSVTRNVINETTQLYFMMHHHGHRNVSKNVTSFSRVAMRDEEIVKMMQIAHALHCVGIAILALLVLEVYIKMAAMSKEFFRHKIEILDTVVISTSFVFDIVFLSDVQGEESEKAAAVVVILLMWRIARITDSILMTVKQRQEFRIRLQKGARRKAERKMEMLDELHHQRLKEIAALKELCYRANIKKEEVDACCPKRERRMSSTLNALSSVAKLSFGMAMSMSSGSIGSTAALPTTDTLISPNCGRRHIACPTTHLPFNKERSGPANTTGVEIVIDSSSNCSPAPNETNYEHTNGLGDNNYACLPLNSPDDDVRNDDVIPEHEVKHMTRLKGSEVYLLTSYC